MIFRHFNDIFECVYFYTKSHHVHWYPILLYECCITGPSSFNQSLETMDSSCYYPNFKLHPTF